MMLFGIDPDEKRTRREWETLCQNLEYRAGVAQAVARRLWAHLSVERRRALWDDVFDVYGNAAVEPAVEAMLRLQDRHRIHVEPCRTILDSQRWGEDFLLVFPGGEKRNVTRAQLLMMAGIDE